MSRSRERFSRAFTTLGGLMALATGLIAGGLRAADKSEQGEGVFANAQPPCGVCHTLADADATGKLGPNLDSLRPTEQRVRAAVRDGVGVMPQYADQLTREEIEAVSEYVSSAARKPSQKSP